MVAVGLGFRLREKGQLIIINRGSDMGSVYKDASLRVSLGNQSQAGKDRTACDLDGCGYEIASSGVRRFGYDRFAANWAQWLGLGESCIPGSRHRKSSLLPCHANHHK